MTEPDPAGLSSLARAADGVLLASPRDVALLTSRLAGSGYAVAEVRLPVHPLAGTETLARDPAAHATSLREAQAEIARELRLPEAAARDLDALTDSLRELATWWPDQERVALVVHGAEGLVETDLPGWHILLDVLTQARQDLRRGRPGDRELLVVAVVDGHGVLARDGETGAGPRP